MKIGVFVCHCGSNIAATVDVKKVVEMVKYLNKKYDTDYTVNYGDNKKSKYR